ncbi:thiamine pyrophosphate-dependent enzyme [Notoacmeibacter sp. MSK16QG-6]|uniref:thiamine pyrophosphate-dependent enzyme n=1 Tax=Notoacmeibacter sp. MSK16QG-6 TaxID=2957982 RepID=UPI00209F037E|nr:thiamine pyrophosphate-dependent enzyme [Notoacmeibacter sp. MSK16QG-6]MCP1200799.1 3-methyl-2-oxobutanoate dehydrogenase (2-methylpropanoyl-transferring) subunit alpha [Notoacmeibacter sp. MSK16QG-6]
MKNRTELSLYVPEPSGRPGDEPDFSNVALQDAGEQRCPDTLTPEIELRDMPYGLIRVLDDEGKAVGPWTPDLPADHLLRGLDAMVRTRIFDDRMFRANRQGKTSFYMKSSGEEAIGAAQSLCLGERDMCFPTYRILSWLMARDYPMTALGNQIFSNAEDPLKGRQMPVLYSARDYGFYSISGNLGSRLGHAVGWAMASAYRHDDSIALGYVGEGTTAEGNVHEALTFAGVYRPPVILCVTNNQWAISSFSGIAGGNRTTFAAKALAYGIPGLRVDGNDFLAIHAATNWARERALGNKGATLIELVTYRASAHSSSDDPTRYRPKNEDKAWPLGDPIERLKQHLIVRGDMTEDDYRELYEDCEKRVRASIREAEAIGTLGQSKPSVKAMFEQVFKEPDWRQIEQRREVGY